MIRFIINNLINDRSDLFPFSVNRRLPSVVDVVVSQDLDRDPGLPEEHVLGQILIVPQINPAKTQQAAEQACIILYISIKQDDVCRVCVCVFSRNTKSPHSNMTKRDKLNH